MTISPVQNVSVCGNNAIVQSDRGMVVAPRADIIVKKFRLNNGVVQCSDRHIALLTIKCCWNI